MAEDSVSSDFNSSGLLFPSAGSRPDVMNSASSMLFPSASNAHNQTLHGEAASFLQTGFSSFVPTDEKSDHNNPADHFSARLIHQHVDDIHDPEHAHGSDDSASSWDSANSIPGKVRGKKHKYVSTDSVSDESSRRSSKKMKRKKKHKHKDKKDRHSKEAVSKLKKPDTIWLDDCGLDSSDAFRTDTRPDLENLQFDSLYRMDVAQYYEHNTYQCLGLGKRDKVIVYAVRKKKKKGKSVKENDNLRYFDTKKVGSCATELDASMENIFVHNIETENFLPLKRTKVTEDEHSSQIKIGSSSDKLSFTEQSKLFSLSLKDHPNDITEWIRFIDFQDELAFSPVEPALNAMSDTNSETASPKAILEKKIAIAEKALKLNPASVKLISVHMNLVKDMWNTEQVIDKWKKLLFQFSNKSKLWKEYLLFFQSSLASMTVSKVADAYTKCFAMLTGIIEGTVKSHNREEYALVGLVQVLVQFVIFLWQAGFTERAIATMVSVLEFNMRQPEELKSAPLQAKKSFFEAFYGSGTKRFGQHGAIGWNSWMSLQQGASDSTSSISSKSIDSETLFSEEPIPSCLNFEEILISHHSRAKQELWVELESIRMFTQIEPYVASSEVEECDDIERMILFDDLSFCLFDIPSKELQFQLALVCLLLHGVPVCRNLLHTDVSETIQLFSLLNSSHNHSLYSCFCHSTISSNFVHFSESMLFHSSGNVNVASVRTIRLLFSHILPHLSAHHQQQMAIIWLHFESLLFKVDFENIGKELTKTRWKELRKFSKALLKLSVNRSCVELWTNYATMEYNLGNVDEGDKIFETASMLCQQMEQGSTVESFESRLVSITRKKIDVLLQLAVEKSSLLDDMKRKILLAIYAFVELSSGLGSKSNANDSLGPARQLRALKHFRTKYETVLNILQHSESPSPLKMNCIVDFLICYITFEYFSSGFKTYVRIFDEIFLKSSTERRTSTNLLSNLACYCVALGRLHMKTRVVDFQWVRDMTKRMLELFPLEVFINEAFLEVKQRGADSLAVRRCYEQILKGTSDVRPWISAINYEMSRLASQNLDSRAALAVQISADTAHASTGVHHRIRSLYRRMCNMHTGSYCSDLWLAFFRFEGRYGTAKDAKKVYYDALQHCPWAKS